MICDLKTGSDGGHRGGTVAAEGSGGTPAARARAASFSSRHPGSRSAVLTSFEKLTLSTNLISVLLQPQSTVCTMNWAQLQHETLILVAWRPCESQEHRRQHPPESKTGSMHYIKRETLVAASQHHDRNSVEKLPSRCPACEDLLLLPLNGVALSGGSCLSDVNRPALCLLALLLGDVEEALTERCPLILIKGRSRRNVTTAASLRRHCSSSSLAHPAMSRPRRICDATTELEIGCRRLNCLTAYRSHTSSTSVCS